MAVTLMSFEFILGADDFAVDAQMMLVNQSARSSIKQRRKRQYLLGIAARMVFFCDWYIYDVASIFKLIECAVHTL